MGELIVYGIKVTLYAVAIGAVFLAITAITNLIITVTMSSVIGEVLSIIGVFMPWNASAMQVFQTAIASIIAFAIARVVFKYTRDFISGT